MPNTGKPSRDCHLCRQRRVKCDLARPSCQRCIKYGKPCPGYRDEQDLVFRHAAPAALKKSRGARQAARSRETTVASSAASTPESTSPASVTQAIDLHSNPATAAVLRGIKEPWVAHSIPLLLMCYPIEFLAGIFKDTSGKNDALVSATHLWARTYLASRFHAPQDPRETEQCLSTALSNVATSIRDPSRATSDTTIMAVWLLGMYELQIGGVDGGQNAMTAWNVHSNGLSSLLLTRGTQQFFTAHGRNIFWSVFTIIQINCIITSAQCPPESDMWLDTIEAIGDEDEMLIICISRYIVQACRIFPVITPMLVEGRYEEACNRWEQIAQEVDDLEDLVARWMATGTTAQRDSGPITDYFLNSWRCARIKLHHITILLSNIVQYGPAPSPVDDTILQRRRQLARVIIASAAQDILDSVPVSLGGRAKELTSDLHAAWFEGIRLIWPLATLYTVRTIPPDLRIVAKAALITVGTERGILQALKSHPGPMPYVPEALIGIPMDEIPSRSPSQG
ncbi:hypothetical protein B0T11DRAFT_50364 [Plectosphaerella cucumerina]|uniref:Zn(2)-C6 fungal-type domain-containing protein n=1 Tax=Plectosphaerella cucumerina TaxID=40658 RepID=A0A8K0THD0_9PEZI|nr:hypothetical protein B0T11DRAFT_50364 [Plectosphaerella cucumerina]